MNQRKISRKVYLLVALSFLLLFIGGSYLVYAAMTAQDQKENDFLIGQVETKLEEDFNEDITEIRKGTLVEKEVTIKNTGTINQFVRVMVLPEVRKKVGEDPEDNEQVLPLQIGTDLSLEGLDSSKWIDGGDGYYYYVEKALEPNTSTTALFESVRLSDQSDQLDERYHDADFSISLKVETINCAEFAYRDAWWQGNTPNENPLKTIDEALDDLVEN